MALRSRWWVTYPTNRSILPGLVRSREGACSAVVVCRAAHQRYAPLEGIAGRGGLMLHFEIIRAGRDCDPLLGSVLWGQPRRGASKAAQFPPGRQRSCRIGPDVREVRWVSGHGRQRRRPHLPGHPRTCRLPPVFQARRPSPGRGRPLSGLGCCAKRLSAEAFARRRSAVAGGRPRNHESLPDHPHLSQLSPGHVGAGQFWSRGFRSLPLSVEALAGSTVTANDSDRKPHLSR